MPRPVAVFTDLEDLDPTPGITLLTEAGFEVRIADAPDADSIVRAAADAVGLLVGYAPVDAALLDRLPSVRIIATLSAGYDQVDIEAARARGVWVCNLPDAATEEVAVHALASALALVRRLPQADATVRGGGWNQEFTRRELPRRTSELTLGIIGMGRIGSRLADFARPVFGRVAGFDPRGRTGRWPAHVESLDLDGLIENSDVLSLHLPLTPSTRGLIGRRELGRMPRGSFLVNVSRGGLLDHAALLEALDEGRLTGAALDVLPEEPPADGDPLRTHPRLLLSPHSAYLSDAANRAYVERPAANLVAWYRTGRPLTPVPEGVPA